MLSAPSCERNREAILQAISPFINRSMEIHLSALKTTSPRKLPLLIEVAAGTGQHMFHFSPHFPKLCYLPTDVSQTHLASIEEYRKKLDPDFASIFPATFFDVSADWRNSEINRDLNSRLNSYFYDHQNSTTTTTTTTTDNDNTATITTSGSLPDGYVDFMFCANMIHISSDSAVAGLFRNAGSLLKAKSGLLLTYGAYAFQSVIQPQSNVNFDRSLKAQNSEWGLRDVDALKELAETNGLQLIDTRNLPSDNHLLIFQKEPETEI